MILVAPTAFKGTHAAPAVAAAAARGAAGCSLPVHTLPVSDGGPGLIDALSHAGWRITDRPGVTGPLGDPVGARILASHNQAVVESADACGITLLSAGQLNPLQTTSFGVGELIERAAATFQSIHVGLGGSATIDGGLGMAAALGWKLLDADGNAIDRAGRGVLQLAHIEGDPPLLPEVIALSDVRNPLYGPDGAARTFGAQKGATAQQVAMLDAGLERLAEIIRRDLGVDVGAMEGAGAAGGLGAGLHAFAGARLVSGSEWVLERLGFDALLARARAVITGEGSFDAQSGMGKITGEIIERARVVGVPVLLIAGRIDGETPAHVHAFGNHEQLTLSDIESLVRNQLPQLLAP